MREVPRAHPSRISTGFPAPCILPHRASRRSFPPVRGMRKINAIALHFAAILGSSLAFVPASALHAQSGNGGAVRAVNPDSVPRPAMRAVLTDQPIRIDGILDEAAWATADSATDFITAIPRDGYPATERTVARVLIDGDHLYVGAMLYDGRPEMLYSPGLEQDFPTHDADLFGIVLDTFLDRQNGIMFAVSPANALFDAQAFNDSREVNTAWEGVIETGTVVGDDGWSVEMAIPLRTLRFRTGTGEQGWGINFLRRIRRLNEDSYWAPLQRQFRLHKMSRAGSLIGLENLRQGRNLTVKPYASAQHVRRPGGVAPGDEGGDFDAGFDLKYGVSSRLTLDVTAFTDFSQVEVDQEQVNLTRFSLFFPEKRDFFLENDGIFTLGDVTERNTRTGSGPRDFKLFYSRSIGLSEDRRPIPILGGARLSGRAGSTEIGLLNMQTRSSDGQPAENFAVARLRQNFGATADIGLLVTNRQGTSDGTGDAYNRAAGLDANVRLMRYGLVNAYAAATTYNDASGDRGSAYLQAAWRDRIWDTSAFVKHVGDGFDPGVGFIQRTGIRQAFGTFGAHPQPGVPHVQEINPYFDASAIENLDGALETRWFKPGMLVTFDDGGTFEVDHEDRFERLFEPASIAGTQLLQGDYAFARTSLQYTSSGARRLGGSLGFSTGEFYNGDRTSVNARIEVRPSAHLGIEAFVERNDIELSGTKVAADVFGGRVRYAASTRLFTSAFVQYIESADELVSNIRVNYIHAPLSDVFLVFAERRNLDDSAATERTLTVKVTKLLSF